ncbi:hypothetical protein VNI00_014768 [Paramarasmius palmivorus]|uniref:Uncharacterized protein n=1 Tax=Paramarasmius palmivorus TaxID=297713 RepID=A0AAW0BR50_9AGAR
MSTEISMVYEDTLQGTSISLYGYVPDFEVNLDARLGPESSSARTTTYWYQSPSLADQEHTIDAWFEDRAFIDYVLIQAGGTTDLSGKTIFVDDANEDEIWYAGQWKASADDDFGYSAPSESPTGYHTGARTIRKSTMVGDSIEFRFSGSSISVYGMYHDAEEYSTIDFGLDGSITHIDFPPDLQRHLTGARVNYLLYENTTLVPGNHTLTLNVTSLANNSDFYIDYITYKSAFSFLHEKPTFIRGSDDQPSPAQSSGFPIGAIVGIVIAGLAITALSYCLWRRRCVARKEAKIASSVKPFATYFAVDSNPKSTDGKGPFPYKGTARSTDLLGEGSSHITPQHMTEVQRRNNEITSLTARMEHSDIPTRGELFARINALTMEVERLVRENAPPEYGGSVADLGRLNSRSKHDHVGG